MSKGCIVSAEDLRAFGKGVFVEAGVSEQHAEETAEILVDANLRGVDTHGIYLSNVYARRLKLGLINPAPKFVFEKKRAGIGVLEADFSLGQPAALEATRKAVDLARDAGVGVVTVKNSNHFGAASFYGEYCAEAGCVGLIMSDGECDVIPFGGKEKFCGTNPLCCCVPTSKQPWFCMDMATSEVAYGKVRAAAEAGKTIPGNWAVDREGHFVTDASKAYAMVPMSGAKGFAIGLMLEIFSSRFTGMPYGPHIIRKFDDWDNKAFMGHYIQAIDISAFLPLDEYLEGMDELVRDLKSQPTADGIEEILLPGEPEWKIKNKRLQEGIPVREEDANLLRTLGKDFNVSFPG